MNHNKSIVITIKWSVEGGVTIDEYHERDSVTLVWGFGNVDLIATGIMNDRSVV